MNKIGEIFGSYVFSDRIMRERLPKDTYKALKKTITDGKRLDPSITNVVASVMKDWAIEKGATHFTHWFQPMTGITAEKHDSFIEPEADGTVIMEFTGKNLMSGEADASSFPSGGLRATFEARGYTTWDPTSYAFIKNNTLCIPTAFCAYGGEALDKKTPLLRSMDAVSKHALRILRLFGNESARRVVATVGAEQEYFLIDKEMFNKRSDLLYCGRTLFGAKSPKDQQKDDHYFGTIKPRVKAFMKELDEELWKLGVYAKTEHNEAAPAQHELAPIFTSTNIAADQNQLMMELMKTVADRHGLCCILHEKPFSCVNGSGKHNNWSLSTNDGENLLNPGDKPEHNAQFLLFLTAVIKAVDTYQGLLRASVASAGNDHRLGESEAPPAIISMFLGDELSEILESVANGEDYVRKEAGVLKIAKVLPAFLKDTTDRNRTSPFAFTGNKFEFRMLGSSSSISEPNTVINTAVAEVLDEFATLLEESDDFTKTLNDIMKSTLKEHSRIIFNENNYSDEWTREAERRGLLNLKTTVDALPSFIEKKNIDLFTKHNIYTEAEIYSRYEILLEEYSKTINIEAITMRQMLRKEILPAITSYMKELAETVTFKKSACEGLSCGYETDILKKLSLSADNLHSLSKELDAALLETEEKDALTEATAFKDKVIPVMREIRIIADECEMTVAKKYWPYPSYGRIMFSE